MKNFAKGSFDPDVMNGHPIERQEGRLCDLCEGRGWIYLRTYEVCPECEGKGVLEAQNGVSLPA